MQYCIENKALIKSMRKKALKKDIELCRSDISMVQTGNQPLEIPVPNHQHCGICRANYEDFQNHIDSKDHQSNINVQRNFYDFIDREFEDLNKRAKTKVWKTSPKRSKVNSPQRSPEHHPAFLKMVEKPTDNSVSGGTVAHQATAAGTSLLASFSATTLNPANQKLRQPLPFKVFDDNADQLPGIQEEAKDQEMSCSFSVANAELLHYAKTLKELEDQECYEQWQMQQEVEALRD